MFIRFMCLADREAENLLTEIMNQLWFTIYILVECQNTINVVNPFVIANFSSSLGEYQVYLWEKFLVLIQKPAVLNWDLMAIKK